MIPYMKAKIIFIGKKQKPTNVFEKERNQNGQLKEAHFPARPILNIFLA